MIPADIEENININITQIRRWLKSHAPHVFDEQIHLDEGTEEKAYWHYGYLTALENIQCILTGETKLE